MLPIVKVSNNFVCKDYDGKYYTAVWRFKIIYFIKGTIPRGTLSSRRVVFHPSSSCTTGAHRVPNTCKGPTSLVIPYVEF